MSKSNRERFAILARNKRPLKRHLRPMRHVVRFEGSVLGDTVSAIDDLILSSMVKGLRDMDAMSGSGRVLSVRGSEDSVYVKTPRMMCSSEWADRLRVLSEGAKSIVDRYPSISFNQAVYDMVIQDGWVFNGATLKTPAWMVDHLEVPVADVLDELPWFKSVMHCNDT